MSDSPVAFAGSRAAAAPGRTAVAGAAGLAGLLAVGLDPEGWLALGLGIVAVGVVALASPFSVLVAVLVVMQFGTAAEWLVIAEVGGTAISAFDLVLLLAGVRILARQAEVIPVQTPFHHRARQLLVAIVVWSVLVQCLVFFMRGADYFMLSTITFGRAILLEAILLFALIVKGVSSRDEVLRLYRVFLVLVLLQALFALFQAYLAPALGIGPAVVTLFSSAKFAHYYGTDAFRAVGFIGAGREMAGLVNMAIFAWLGVAAFSRGSLRARALIATAVLLLALFRTLSKFEVVSFAAGALYFAFRSNRISWKVMMLGVIVLIPFMLPENAVRGFQDELESEDVPLYETSSGARMMIWLLRVLPLVKASPVFGHGWGAETHDTAGPVMLLGATHNQYFQWWISVGFVGMVVFLVFLVLLLRRAMELAQAGDTRADRIVGMGVTGALITLMLSNLYSDMLAPGTGTNRAFWVLAGLFYAYLAYPAADRTRRA